MVGCLPSMHDSVGSISESHKPVTTMHICNSNTRGMEKGGSRVQEQCWLHSEFEASPGYMRLCLIKIESHGVITTWLQASLLFLHNKRAIIITWGLNSLLQDVADFPFIRVFWKSLWWTFIIFHGFFFFQLQLQIELLCLGDIILCIGYWVLKGLLMRNPQFSIHNSLLSPTTMPDSAKDSFAYWVSYP